MSTCYLNGQFLPLEEARISPLDRGFVFGDGVYEVVACYGGRPFRMQQHLDRLQRSCNEIQLRNPHDNARWTELIDRLLDGSEADLAVYFQITRGVAKRDHRFPKDTEPTVFMMVNPLATPSDSQFQQGLSCISADDFRWLKCHVKSTSLLGNVLARQAAADAGADEVILFRNGYLTEAAACNVFIVRNGTVLVPPKSNLLLPGITDDFIVELMRANGVPYAIRPVAEWEVRNADEIWLSSTTKEVMPVVQLDGRPVGHGPGAGEPGPVARRLRELFHDYKVMFIAGRVAATALD